MKPKIYIFGLFSLFAAFSVSVAQNSNVENEGADCPVTINGNGASSSNANLPDLFMKMNGQRMTTKDEWRCRRQEIRKLLEKTIYGEMHVTPYSATTGTVSNTSISGTVSDNDKSVNISATVSVPRGCALPVPAVFSYGGFGGVDATTLSNNCVATINFDPGNAGAEGTGRTAKRGYYYTLYGGNSNLGILAAQAWAISRFIDIIQKSDGSVLKWDALGVTGCSRYGKGAFAAGVFDQRMALTMPIESGTGGVPVMRSVSNEGKQAPSSAYGEQPWLGDVFSAFQNSPNTLPTDMHGAVAMIAPRGLVIFDNPHIANLGPKSAHLSAKAAAEVYIALGYGGNITYHSNVADGSHCAWRGEWTSVLDANIKKFLKPTGTNTGGNSTINPHTNTKGDEALINWTAPDLAGSLQPGGSSSSTVNSSSSSAATSSSSARSSSSSSVRSSSSAVTLSSSSFTATSSSSSNNVSSSSNSVPPSSDSVSPITLGKIPATHFSARFIGNGVLQIESGVNTAIYLYDTKGNIVFKGNVKAGSSMVNYAAPPGLYVLKNSATNQMQTMIAK